jgi:DNA mismatch endonuclease (patch repair protein)
LHRADLPGRPDLVFPGRRKVVFVHGCFWHSHADPACNRARVPKTRTEYWTAKLARNAARDRDAAIALEEAGWEALTIWECELRDPSAALTRARAFLDAPTRR